jgi:RimJ/RimL family protein N-acetyltransferase
MDLSSISFAAMTPEYASQIVQWKYGGEYSIYDRHESIAGTGMDDLACVASDGALAGWIHFGEPARIPTVEENVYDDGFLDLGVGLRPELCGKGLGLTFVRAVLEYARKEFGAERFRLSVAAFNERAKKVYARAGFVVEREITNSYFNSKYYLMKSAGSGAADIKGATYMNTVNTKSAISEARALEIVGEFLEEIRAVDDAGIIALYVIGSLGGGYYRPGQSDIDTVIIVRDDAVITEPQCDEIADRYREKYAIPKGFGSIVIHERELYPPYTKSETDEFEFSVEIARLKTQGKAIYGKIDYLDKVPMPTREHLIKDGQIFERWIAGTTDVPSEDNLSEAACVNSVLMYLRRWLMIEKGVFEFNKFLVVDEYMRNAPPLIDERVFTHIRSYLRGETHADGHMLTELRECVKRLRKYYNKTLYGM